MKRNIAKRLRDRADIGATPKSLSPEMALEIANDDLVRVLQKLAAAINKLAEETAHA